WGPERRGAQPPPPRVYAPAPAPPGHGQPPRREGEREAAHRGEGEVERKRRGLVSGVRRQVTPGVLLGQSIGARRVDPEVQGREGCGERGQGQPLSVLRG